MHYTTKSLFPLTWIYTALLFACFFTETSATSWEYVRYSTFLSHGCWKELISSIQGATTPLRDCFYPEKYSLEDNLAEMLFLDKRNKRPDVLFDPVEYARHLGLVERERYVTRSVGGSERYSLNISYAEEVLRGGDDAVKYMYYVFCGTRLYLTPVLECLHREMLLITPNQSSMECKRENLDDIVDGFMSSKVEWDTYGQFCQQVFHCSKEPVKECLTEIGVTSPQSVSPLESVCNLIANIDALRTCIKRKTRDCVTKRREAFAAFADKMRTSIQHHVGSVSGLSNLCRKMRDSCSLSSQITRMEQLVDECMEYFYNVMLALGDTGLDRLSRGGPYLHLLPDKTASLCNNLTLTFQCLNSKSSNLSCQSEFLDVFRTVMLKLSVNCGYFSISRQTKSRVNIQPDTGEGNTTLQITDGVTSRLTYSQTSTTQTSTTQTSTTTTKEANTTGILEEEEGSNNGAVGVTTTFYHFLGTAVIVIILI